jgi:hypothetical protein
MKTREKILFGLGLVILILLHWFLFPSKPSEGFFDTAEENDALRRRLQSDLGSYCKVADFVREQVKEMQDGLKKTSSMLPSADAIKAGSNSPAAKNTQALMSAMKKEGWYNYETDEMYTNVYQCKDQLANVRPSCGAPNFKMRFIPCSVYMDLPSWSDENTIMNALRKINDDLPERMVREVEWFTAVIQKLQQGLAAGADPGTASGLPPDTMPSSDDMKKYEKEAFVGTCSSEAANRLRQRALDAEANACAAGGYVQPTPSSEIARINLLLDNQIVKNYAAFCNVLYDAMLKLQSDLEKLKNGTLYPWQQGGPKKSFKKFDGGDRIKSLLFSMAQNRS